MIVLHSESFEHNLFELDFSISKKRVSSVKPSQGDEFLHGYEIFFSTFFLLSLYQNTSESIRPCFQKKIRHESTTLECSPIAKTKKVTYLRSKFDPFSRKQKPAEIDDSLFQCDVLNIMRQIWHASGH